MVYITPWGGLCNMIRTIVSAYNISKITGLEFSIFWGYTAKDANPSHAAEISLRYDEIFENEILPVVYELPDNIVNYVDEVPLHSYNPLAIDRLDMGKLVDMSKTAEHIQITSWGFSYDSTTSDDRYVESGRLLKFRQEYLDIVDRTISSNVIGVHIRRSDFSSCNVVKPLEHFITAMTDEIMVDDTVKFFVATDDKHEEQTLINIFGADRIITFPKDTYSRNDPEFIKAGIIDLLCLSRCTKLYGTRGSTFSYLASKLQNIPIIE